jgi:hypothetical protein
MTDNDKMLSHNFQMGFDDALVLALDVITDLMETEQYDNPTLHKAYDEIEKQSQILLRSYGEVAKVADNE